MSINHYLFQNVWQVGAAPDAVFAALVDLAEYPAWWPEIRSVRRIDDDTAEVRCLALLPYSLTFRLHRAEQDERTGLLRVLLTGDLEGECVGRIGARRPAGARLEISLRVEANKRLLRALAPLARPVFRANHTVMMRRGERGLRDYLHTRG